MQPHFDGTPPSEICRPENMYNPVHARHYAALAARILDPEAPLPPLHPAVDAYMRPSKELLAAADKPIAAYRASVGPALKRNPKTELLAGRRLYNETPVAGVPVAGRKRGRGQPSDALEAADAEKKARAGDDDADALGVAGLFRSDASRVDKVGTVRPIDDFKAMLERRDRDLVSAAVMGMTTAIKTLVAEPDQEEKARDCLAELRVGCLANAVETLFNDVIRELKAEHGPSSTRRHGDAFWQRVVNSGVSLISASESANSDVSDEDKMLFLSSWSSDTPHVSQARASSVPSAVVDDDLDIE